MRWGGASVRCGGSTRLGGSLREGESYVGVGASLRRSGRAGSTRSRPRMGLSPGAVLSGGSTRIGCVVSPPVFVGGVTDRRSGRSSAPVVGLGFPSPLFTFSRGIRAGLVTAPVGRDSTSPVAVGLTTVVAGRASRPLNTRERRSSVSIGTPGVRAPAPVDTGESEAEERTLRGLPSVVGAAAVTCRAGSPRRVGVAPVLKTCRANASLARAGRASSLPT